jgi:hypothetical protein
VRQAGRSRRAVPPSPAIQPPSSPCSASSVSMSSPTP